MDDYTTTIAASILVYILIGNYARRGIRNLDDYSVAGRRAPTLFIVGTLIASMMSSTMFLVNGVMMPLLLTASWSVVWIASGVFAYCDVGRAYSAAQ